jgi:hypothetical protein
MDKEQPLVERIKAALDKLGDTMTWQQMQAGETMNGLRAKVAADIAQAENEKLREALTEISKRCPPLPEGFDEFATISDFGGNADDYAAHVEKLISATTGDIARAAINAATGGQQ